MFCLFLLLDVLSIFFSWLFCLFSSLGSYLSISSLGCFVCFRILEVIYLLYYLVCCLSISFFSFTCLCVHFDVICLLSSLWRYLSVFLGYYLPWFLHSPGCCYLSVFIFLTVFLNVDGNVCLPSVCDHCFKHVHILCASANVTSVLAITPPFLFS